MGPISALPAVRPAAYEGENPSFTMGGMRIDPSAEASAAADPFTPARIIPPTTFTYPRPPLTDPTRSRLKSRSLSVSPDLFMSIPARMKNGMAIREKTSIPPKNCWLITRRSEKSPSIIIPSSDVDNREIKSGTPMTIRPRKANSIDMPIYSSPFLKCRKIVPIRRNPNPTGRERSGMVFGIFSASVFICQI